MQTKEQVEYWPATHEIRGTFEDAIAAAGGAVTDAFEKDDLLFLRAVIGPGVALWIGDEVQGGVALRTSGPEILIHPYTYRQICTNGAIRAHALETRRITRLCVTDEWASSRIFGMALRELRKAVAECGSSDVLRAGLKEMRSAAEVDADTLISVMPHIARMFAPSVARHVTTAIRRRFERAPDPGRSAFGIMNAITSVGRDTRDPETRWQLERIGAEIPALVRRRHQGGMTPRERTLVGA